ncbi:MAG TPA: SHOCT domain-containing protein [Smithellaceae bacterium]|jgi:hypothetical protein|nr:SHOCT domain-containing protein [Smithellaceae bacterium]HQM43983.1 SHOCT domain-containing protein [Smithellaceae bacterium]
MIISLVYAVGGNPGTTSSTSGFGDWSFIIMMVVIFAIFYFFMIRPQRKKGELVMPNPAKKHLPKKHSPFMRAVIIWLLILIAGLMLQTFILDVVINIKTTSVPENIVLVLVGLSYLIVIFLSFWGAYKVYRKYDSINKEMIAAYKDPLTCLPDFEATQVIMGVDDLVGLAIDEEKKKVCLINYASNEFRVIFYKEILGVEVFEDKAIIAGDSQKTKHEGTVSRIDVRLTINDTRQPIFDINYLHFATKKDDPAYQQALQRARQCHGLIKVLIKRADMEDKQQAQAAKLGTLHPVNQAISLADELKKMSDLKDSGVLTPEEFERQKAKLLNT